MDTVNLVLILLASFVNLATAYFVIELRKVVSSAAENILKVEKATNSMKDALVAATAKASLAEGKEQGRETAMIEEKERGLVEPVRGKTVLPIAVLPVPVADERTAKAAEQTAKATEQIAEGAKRSATADERLADVAETRAEISKEKDK